VLSTVSDRKHQAIARAALMLFASDGYERTSVDAIAAEAGVSKRTVYSHYGDKETLFLSVVRDTYEVMLARIGEIVGRVAWERDLRSALICCMTEVTRSVIRSPERSTLVRLLMAEAPHFPDLIELLHARQITPLVAAPLENLAAAGRLAGQDGRQAAEHLMALTFGQVSNRSLMGTVPLSDDEAGQIVQSGVQAFLRAYSPAIIAATA
jgi:TetR/AcrR family transcriptional regulator, mexJK operon transcriptional repressor